MSRRIARAHSNPDANPHRTSPCGAVIAAEGQMAGQCFRGGQMRVGLQADSRGLIRHRLSG
jgi:hypothetical protein